MSWPTEPNWGTILVSLWFGLGPTLTMYILYQLAFSHPMGTEDDELAAQAEQIIAAQGLRE